MIKSTKRNRFSLSLMAAAVCLSSVGAYAAGLGKITVLSPLGQPLRAELDVTASREELASMSAKLASPEAFKQVGIEYLPAFSGIRFVLDKRSDGQPFLRLSTDRPMNEPFLDILVELTWASGRMVREYTMLLDPPDVFSKSAPAPVSLPESKPAQKEPASVAPPPPPVKAQPVQAEKAAEPAKAQPQPAEKKAAVADTRLVKSGDTLTKIAEEARPEGVSLDQMLVALFRGNPEAFSGNNMNRLKAGKILSIPSADTATAVAAGEAHRTVVAQARDFNAYRRKLAAAVAATPAKEEVAKQQDTGKIAPKVEEKTAEPAATKDKLEVSRTEAPKDAKAVQGRISALEEDLVSREKSLREASSRVAELEKNLSDLKKLAELKSQAGVEAQQLAQLQAKPAVEPVAPAPVKPVETAPTKPAEEPRTAEKPAEEAKVAEKPAEAAVVAPAKPEVLDKPKHEARPPAAKVPASQPPQPEAGFFEENPEVVYGGGGLLALLLGWLGYSSWRRKKGEGAASPSTASRLSESDLTANSVFGSTGGQSVNTGASIQTDFSQANLTSIDADEGVDPVAEADVYMAYGRDAQAEEILLDALKHDPSRHAVHLKLMEIYSGRKDARQFESIAKGFHVQTGGAGPDWEKAADMGRLLDADNPLYGGAGGGVASAAALASATETVSRAMEVQPSEVQKLHDTVTLPGQLGQMAAAAATSVAAPPATLDFELDLGSPAKEPKPATAAATEVPTTLDFNLDLGSGVSSGTAVASTTKAADVVRTESAASTRNALDFEFDLDVPPAPPSSPAQAAASTTAFDLSSIDLELAAPGAVAGVGRTGADAAAETDNPDAATKLELAQAYEEMGDKEGARELLQEVVQEGSIRQQGIARNKLASLNT